MTAVTVEPKGTTLWFNGLPARDALADMGFTTIAVLNTERHRAALYFRCRPVGVLLLTDPDAVTHTLFGVPEVLADEAFARVRINPTGELPSPMHPMDANRALNEKDGFEMKTVDDEIFAAHGRQPAIRCWPPSSHSW